MPSARGVVLSATLLGLAPVLVACSSTPEIAAYVGDDDGRAACEALVAELPDELADEPRVDVEPADALGAAYGDPAITVTCGIAVPSDFNQASRCDEADGVGWFIPDRVNDSIDIDLHISPAGYRPVLGVVVPADLRPQSASEGDAVTAAVLAQLSPLVSEHLELVERCDG